MLDGKGTEAPVMQVMDFVSIKELERYVHFVDGGLPISNADACEDVAGGLEVSTVNTFLLSDKSWCCHMCYLCISA